MFTIGSSVPSYAQVKFWVGGFKWGRTSLEDEARSVPPLDATDDEMCKKIWDLVHSDSSERNSAGIRHFTR